MIFIYVIPVEKELSSLIADVYDVVYSILRAQYITKMVRTSVSRERVGIPIICYTNTTSVSCAYVYHIRAYIRILYLLFARSGVALLRRVLSLLHGEYHTYYTYTIYIRIRYTRIYYKRALVNVCVHTARRTMTCTYIILYTHSPDGLAAMVVVSTPNTYHRRRRRRRRGGCDLPPV